MLVYKHWNGLCSPITSDEINFCVMFFGTCGLCLICSFGFEYLTILHAMDMGKSRMVKVKHYASFCVTTVLLMEIYVFWYMTPCTFVSESHFVEEPTTPTFAVC